jgi:hypothetical protein
VGQTKVCLAGKKIGKLCASHISAASHADLRVAYGIGVNGRSLPCDRHQEVPTPRHRLFDSYQVIVLLQGKAEVKLSLYFTNYLGTKP